MIQRLNEQALEAADEEGAPDVTVRKEKKALQPIIRYDEGAGNEQKSHVNIVKSKTCELKLIIEENNIHKTNPVANTDGDGQAKRLRTQH